LKLIEHDSYDDFIASIDTKYHLYFVTRYGITIPNKLKLKVNHDIYFMFGKESSGIPKEILTKYKSDTVRIPSANKVRSLNLSNCVAIIGYEYSKQNDYIGLNIKEPHKPIF
jgi:tRNA (cytidine/uridine-2'-O-)-methyltransferase